MIFKLGINGEVRITGSVDQNNVIEVEGSIELETFLKNISRWVAILKKFEKSKVIGVPIATQPERPMLILEDLAAQDTYTWGQIRCCLNIVGITPILMIYNGIKYFIARDTERNLSLYFMASKSTKDKYYVVDPTKRTCSCPGYKYRSHCSHIDALFW
jgi:hypothetical protein